MTSPGATAVVPAPSDTLAIDFANTCYWRGSKTPTETLTTPPDLLDWVATTALVPPLTVARVRTTWTAQPGEAADGLAQAIAWREAMARALAAAAAGEAPAPADVALLNEGLARAPARQRLRQSAEGRGWEVAPMPPTVAALLAPVLWSAGDLLAGPRLAAVRTCANPACRFLFLDDSQTGNRRWCSMAACGNRAKAHRHYLRRKAIPPSA